MSDGEGFRTLIFVSHASADIRMVRQVRNYLEEKGALPLLFHLIALTDPQEFWPLIEREIMARNFFLYCDSPAAATSTWVQRERRAVDIAGQRRPKRIGHIQVDQSVLDTDQLDRFLADINVFPMYEEDDVQAVAPFLSALREAGFAVLGDRTLNETSARRKDLKSSIRKSQRGGWVVFFPGQSPNWTRDNRRLLRTYLETDLSAPQPPKVKLVDLGNRLRSAPTAIDGTANDAPAALVNALLAEPDRN